LIVTPDCLGIFETLKQLLDKTLERLVSESQSHLQWSLYPPIWHLDGVTKTVDNKKPEITTPLANFFIIGDRVKSPGIEINCVVNSAKNLVDILQS
jgi:hypothetical protein